MREININTEAPCAKGYECCHSSEKKERLKWLGNEELYVADDRVFIKVRIATPTDSEKLRQYRLNINMNQIYLMDAITGTLYLEDGRCLSSNIVKRTFTRNDELARKIIVKKTVINN
jgi:hypothetical protein